MTHFSVALCEPGANFFWIVLEGAVAALVSNAAVLVNDVEALRPRRICIIGGVVHFIDTKGHGEFETLGEIVSDGHALLDGLRLGIANIVLVLPIGFHLPFVGRMSLAHVDGQKIGVVFVIVVDLNDVANLATERWSSETAENEDERAASRFFANMES